MRCRGCGSIRLELILTPGRVHAIVKFKDSPEEEDDYGSLDLVKCRDCNLVQLKESVAPERLYSQFHYLSGINQSMNDALFDIVRSVENTVQLKPRDVVIDIGANDGTLLSYYRRYVYAIGFEPAKNISPNFYPDEWIMDYFSANRYFVDKTRPTKTEKAKVITAIAMFYDLENPNQFLSDVHDVLSDDGIFVLQMNDLDSMCQNVSIDNICHEHLTYYSMDTLVPLLRQNHLYPIDISYNNVNGGSIRVTSSKTPNDKVFKSYKHAKANVENYCSLELMWRHFEQEKKKLLRYLDKEIENDRLVWGYGASTRGNTLLQLLGLDDSYIRAIADRNPKKWGKYTAGGNIPIISEGDMRLIQPPNLLVLPYYFEQEFLNREIEYLKKGGRMLFPLPKFRIWTASKEGKLRVHGLS